MADKNSLVDLGDLSKPATRLIEKVSDAVGGIAKPWQIERVAKAEAKADIIRAQSRIEISEVEERALQRMVREEGKRQENIENITAQAIPHLNENAKPEDVDDDWISNFFDKARMISDKEMQELWSKLLSGEANNPGSYRKRTVELVASLDKSDAELFSKLCSCIWMIGRPTVLIFDNSDAGVANNGLSFEDLKHLDSLGLIDFEALAGFKRVGYTKEHAVLYFGRPIILTGSSDKDSLNLGSAMLTRVGVELASICPAQPNKDFFEYIIKKFMDDGLAPWTLIGTKAIFEEW